MGVKGLLVVILLFATHSLWAVPKIQNWTTDNGVRVYFVASPEIPIIDIRLVFDAGAAREGDKGGLALLTNGIMSEGAGDWDANMIAERFEGVGAVFGNNSMRDMSIFSLRSLVNPKLLEVAVEVFAKLLNEPSFPQAPFERERKRLLVALEQKKQSPDNVADNVFYQEIYGDHPYAHDPLGSAQSIELLTTTDLRKFYERYLVGSNATVAIVGNVERAQAETLVKQILGDLPKGQPAEPLASVSVLTKAKEVTVDFPSTQTHLLMGQPGLSRSDPDYFSLYLGNHVLGGSGLVSILSEEIREKRGLSYSSYSYFSPMRAQGPFVMGLQTRNDQTQQALQVMKQVLQDFVKNGPTEQQLTAAKQNLTGGFALRIDSNKKIVNYLSMIGFYHLPLDYLDRFIDAINTVTKEQIKQAFQRRINSAAMVTVIVGGSDEK